MQQVIVYSNPAEAAIWNALSSGSAFPVMLAIVAFFMVSLLFNHLIEKMERKSRLRQDKVLSMVTSNGTNISLFIGASAAVFVGWFFWI